MDRKEVAERMCRYAMIKVSILLFVLTLDTGHCINMLREILICQSSTNLIIYHWV